VLVGGNRMVTHYGITSADIDDALDRIRKVAETPALASSVPG
jgi:hypothetical protein